MKKQDSVLQSFFRGRLGAALLTVLSTVATYFGVGADVQQEIMSGVLQSAGALSALGAVVLSVVSKYRSTKE